MRRVAVHVLSLARAAEPLAATGFLPCRHTVHKAAAPLASAFHSSGSSAAGWRFGFSSTSGQSQAAAAAAEGEDKAAAAAEAAAAGAGGNEEQQPQQQGEQQEEEAAAAMSPEELLQAFQEAQEALQGEKKRADDLKDRLLRTLADMENLRERTARTTAEAKQFAVQGLVKSLLEVADNLERAAGSVPPEDVHAESEIDRDRALKLLRSLRDGVLITDTVLMKVLAKEGVTRYDPLGDAFDPNLHNALFQVPDATKEPGTIAVVVKKGYSLMDRVVRAADVGVAAMPDEQELGEPDDVGGSP